MGSGFRRNDGTLGRCPGIAGPTGLGRRVRDIYRVSRRHCTHHWGI